MNPQSIPSLISLILVLLQIGEASGQPFPICNHPRPGTSNCLTATPPPGCGDRACCQQVCRMDSFCCESEWDDACAHLAQKNCSELEVPPLPLYEVDFLQSPVNCFGDPTPILARALSETGTVVGEYRQCLIPSNSEGFVWTRDEGLQTIPRPFGAHTLKAVGVNSESVVAGDLEVGAMIGFKYEEGTFSIVGFPSGGTFSETRAISETGTIVGTWGNMQTGNPSLRAFRWNSGMPEDLNGLDEEASTAADINAKGWITGFSGIPAGPLANCRAYLWQDGKATILPPVIGGYTSIGVAINNQGDIVGHGNVPTRESPGFHRRGFLWSAGTIIDLGMLPGYTDCVPTDVNDEQVVVGFCRNNDFGFEGFIWRQGMMETFKPKVAPGSPYSFTSPSRINNAGQILCGGSLHTSSGSDSGMILLTPLQPITGDLNEDRQIDGIDLGILLSQWLMAGGADLNEDGTVNGIDLGILLGAWTL